MRLSQYIEREPAKRKKSRSKPSGALTAIAAQRFFVPAVCAWGAALLGLSIVVLPDAAINRITVLTSLGFLGSWAKFAYASVAALFGAGIAYFASGSMHERARASDESVSVVAAPQRLPAKVSRLDEAWSSSLPLTDRQDRLLVFR